MFTREQVKDKFENDGWTVRAAGKALGVSYQHVCLVLTGKRKSARLLQEISALPPFEEWRKANESSKVQPA